MEKKSTRKPKLRFIGFSESWEKTTLGELLTFKNGLNAGKEDYGDGEKFINVLDIIQNNFITYDKIIGSVKASEKNKEIYKVEYGDVLFQRSSETREEVGQANVYLDREKPALFGGFVIRGKKKSDYDPIFINHLLKTPLSRQEITSKSGGSTRYNVGQETLSSVEITIATLPEQQKIASFLSSVDERIELLERKKEKLEAYKKGVMQQIFTQQIRFKKDDGSKFPDWEEKKSKDVFMNISNKKHNGDLPILSASQERGMVLREENGIKIQASEKSVTSYKIVEPDDFVISLRSFQGGLDHSKFLGICSPAYTVLRNKIPVEPQFYKFYFKKESFITRLSQTVVGIRDGKQITFDNFGQIKIPYPSVQEQKKIAAFLNTIDQNLETLDSQIQGLSTWKKGLLQQMFV
ncbi:restriction modification system DNA specificity domain-containing protein [Nitritalea halalkaliphila LW7]|uniref:Restriction modification system DNA specificity domain-containing protein n=1 Tax=Nitritalea halalkaliphila LW7 TaxID=1189621 RepID=I5C9B8_9BACT|nr:restriction endonuclease subunit S [Nitritalea halalkaliphila]EIM78420.1 restriction modification system DNA specificity domain-containing protein [Nitritalea halalkaliphila LW7]